MKRAAFLFAVAAMIAGPSAALAAEPFNARLTAEKEVPAPNVPAEFAGGGLASVSISDDGTEITYEVSYHDLTGPVMAAHIHYAPVGEAGGVIFPLEHGDSPFSGTLTEADFTPLDGGPQTFAEALDAIRDRMTYINLHTEANPPGEIRGQLRELPDSATAQTVDTITVGPNFLSLGLVLIGVAFLALSVRRSWLARVRA